MDSEWDEPATQIIQGFAFEGAERILIADANPNAGEWLRSVLGGDVRVESSDNSRRVFERLTADPPRILVVGTNLLDVSGSVLLAHAARYQIVGPHHGPTIFLLGASPTDMPQVDETQVPVFFRLTPSLPPQRICELFQIALQKQDQPRQVAPPKEDPVRTRLVIEHTKRLSMATEAEAAAVAVETAIREVCRADRARVRYFDEDDGGMLWRETKDGLDSSPASLGLAGYVVRAGVSLVLEQAQSDPGYRASVDDPAGSGQERLALVPVRDRDQRIQAVLIAIREPSSQPFTFEDERLLKALAEAWGPFIHQLAQAAIEHQKDAGIFRREAVNHLLKRGNEGDVVRVNPAWVSAAYWIVIVALLAFGAFSYFVHIHQYSQGQAVIRATGRAEAIAFDGGTVTGIDATEGQDVEVGQVLVRLHDTEQATALRALRSEFERKLVAYLQNSADEGVRTALGQTVSELEKASAGVDARVIRASAAGKIRDIHVRVGQRVEGGAVVATIARKDEPEGLSVIAFLPGGDRPRLRARQRIRVNLTGYRGVHFETEVHAISSEVLGAKEAGTRFLGDRLADSIAVSGTVVVVEGTLDTTRFEVEDESFELHDGMLGTAEVELESRSVLATIFPGLNL